MSLGLTASAPAPSQPLALHLVEEISHRVVNEYVEAISILSLASREQITAAPALALAASRLRAHAEAHRALLAPIADGPIDLGLYVGKLCASLSQASLGERGIGLTVTTDEIWLDAARCWRVGLIVSELIRNAARHGLAGRRGTIAVTLAERAGCVRCMVSDNGQAVSNPPEGRGRRLVRALAADLGGSVDWWFTTFGSFVGLEFPAGSASFNALRAG